MYKSTRTPEQRFWAKVDKSGECWTWTGSLTRGHGHMSVNKRTIYTHRFSWELANGAIPEGMQVDHRCHNRACVNPDHLRLVTPKQNNENRAGLHPTNTTGVRGVHWRKDLGKYQVTVKHNNKVHHGGYFDDLDEAAEAARLKRNELFTHNDKDRRAA